MLSTLWKTAEDIVSIKQDQNAIKRTNPPQKKNIQKLKNVKFDGQSWRINMKKFQVEKKRGTK